jgi:hypothetical protein
VADAPDPLGKRALFWAPAERQEAGPRRPEKRIPPGRNALFSAAGTVPPTTAPKRNGRPRPPLSGTPRPVQTARPTTGGPAIRSTSARATAARATAARATAARATAAGARAGRSTTARTGTSAARAAPSGKTTAKVETTLVAPAGGGRPIGLSCSKCGIHTDVDILKYLVLHLPWWLWRPGRGYTSLMKCPACGQRAWISASWQR